MTKLRKYIALRLIALLMFPYSASAAAACDTQLDYSATTGPDFAYESAAYHIGQSVPKACTDKTVSKVQIESVNLPSLSDINDLSL